MMFYSVYDYASRKYTYFESTGVEPASGSFRTPARDRTFPEALAVRLPSGARQVGTGEFAKGVIAVADGRALAAYEAPTLSMWKWPVLAFVVGWFLGRRK